jgi:hypothetical protein
MKGAPSTRTHQRIERVMRKDSKLAALMVRGWCKPGQAERLIKSHAVHRKFRKWLKAQQSPR